jgi:uncharacterized membrane protein
MEPFFTNDAVVLGLLMVLLATVFYTSSLENTVWKKFYSIVPTILLCYFLPALLHWPLGLIASTWFDDSLIEFLKSSNVALTASDLNSMSFEQIKALLIDKHGVSEEALQPFIHKSYLYTVAIDYLLPACLILLCLSVDARGIFDLGPKALIMFFAATLGIIIGGPVALLVVLNFFPDIIAAPAEEVWRGMSTLAGSWIGGSANQTAMKEIYEVSDNLFASMIVVDVVVANIWMGLLLYGASKTNQIDRWLKADNSNIEVLQKRVKAFQEKVNRIPDTTSMFVLLSIAFGGVGLSHWGADTITPLMSNMREELTNMGLSALISDFFWVVVIATTLGLMLSFTKARNYEGVGASRWGSIFIYVLIATIGMKMNLGEVLDNLGLFVVGIIWMLIHVLILLIVAKLIKAPFFFVAVGSQANVGGAASAPVVASAFNPALAPVGVLLAVLGYAVGTYGAIISAYLMQAVAR